MAERLLSLADRVVRLSRSIPAACALFPPVLRSACSRMVRSMSATICVEIEPFVGQRDGRARRRRPVSTRGGPQEEEICRVKRIAVAAEGDGHLYRIFELPDVARPGVAGQGVRASRARVAGGSMPSCRQILSIR